MLSLDLFDSQFEKRLQEGAVDDLEARRIDDLNMRMLDLLDRAKEPAYKKNPAALAGLKKQFQKIKAERDSYFKINPATGMDPTGSLGTVKGALDELGIPGNVPVEKIPGKEDLLKGKGRSYYEDQKKSSDEVAQDQRLHVGDPVVVTAPNEFEGKTGEISEFSPSGKFVVVNLYNHGEHSMHLSDVEFNQYADDQDEDDWYDEVEEGFQDFNRVEPYAVCLSGKPVKKFDYYEEARRFHDNWKQKLYREGNKEKADKITLMPLNLDESTGMHPKLVTVLKQRGYKGPYKLSKLPKWLASLGDVANGDDEIMVTGNDPEYDAWVVYNSYGPYAFGQEMGYQTGTAAKIIKDTVPLDEAGSPAQQAAIAIAMKKAGKKPKHVDETALNPRDPAGDYAAKRRALQDLGMDKEVDQQAVLQRRLDLDREAKAKGLVETVTDVKAGMAKIYHKLAPKIERNRDSFLAGQLYDELENYAELHGAEGEFKRMMNSARNRAHMEYDTNPGGFHNWFWFLPFEDQDMTEDYNDNSEAVERAILNRIMVAHTDLLKQYGPQKVMQAAEEVAYNVGDVDEIGTSDVSGWVHQVQQILGAVQEGLRDPKDNPCWKGYKPVGTKQKGGRTVPNCVPKE